MASTETRPLGQQTLRGFGVFQVIVALPTLVFLGFCAVERLIHPWGLFYYFFAPSVTAIMAAGIIFIVYIQRKAVATPFQTLCLEGAKSVLATGLWLWLILDSAFGPWKVEHHDHVPDTYADPEYVRKLVQGDAFAVIVLLVFFYPPLGHAYFVWRTKSSHGSMDDTDDGGEEGFMPSERAPLLPQGSARSFG